MSKKKYAVIVDGYSAGNFLPGEFKGRGYTSIHVQSTPEIWALLNITYRPADYEAHFAFDGDLPKLLANLKLFNPVCVVAGTETGVELADALSDGLGTPGNGIELSAARRDKYKMIEAVRAKGLLVAEQIKSTDVETILAWTAKHGFSKVVLKPLKSAGTDSVAICTGEAEIRDAFDRILGKVNQIGLLNEEVLAQEFLEGPEFALDLVSLAGKAHCTAIWKYYKVRVNGRNFVYDRDGLVEATSEEGTVLRDYAVKALDALQITEGPSHAEIMLTPRGPALVEVGTRLNGITTPQLNEACVGYGQLDLTVDAYVDPEAFHRKAAKPYVLKQYSLSVSLISEQEGIVKSVPGEAVIRALPSFNEMRMRAKPGYPLRRTVDFFTCPGFVMLVYPEKDQVERDLLVLRALEKNGLYEMEVAPLPLKAWNETHRLFDETVCLHQLFERQADRVPNAVAVDLDGVKLTYAELEARANQLAHYLKARGVGPEDVVGLHIPRSLELMVAVLGVLKAGAAYVPIDPQYPRERLEHMVTDSKAKMLLVHESVTEPLDLFSGESIPFPRADAPWSALPTSSVDSGVRPENLAYLLYTSGSTGRPKGVEVSHKPVINFLSSMQRLFDFTEKEVLLSPTGLSFDIAGLDLYLTWMMGAKLILVPRPVVFDGVRLAKAVEESGATILQTTPVTWRSILDGGWKGKPGFKALCGGEAMPPGLRKDLLDRGVRLWNLYGPTETTIWSTAGEMDKSTEAVTVGRPIDNTEIQILDESLKPVPIGESAELHIGGAGLARGYRGQPQLTAQRFITLEGRKLYKTGDRARYHLNGDIEIVGRLDHQIKVRGYRIEPAEVEGVLRDSGAPGDCVVVSHPTEACLVAYFVGPAQDRGALKLRLEKKLAVYQIPDYFVFLKEFPLTPNGKLDRKQLPVPQTADKVD